MDVGRTGEWGNRGKRKGHVTVTLELRSPPRTSKEFYPFTIYYSRFTAVWCGQGRNRTADAGLFRAALYQLSYLASRGGKDRVV
jgi:hypothetical protein